MRTQLFKTPLCVRERFPRKVHGFAIVSRKIKIAKRERIKPFLNDVLNRIDIAKGLTHLGAIDHQVSVVDPVPNERFTRRCFALGDLVGVVDGGVLNATGMDIDSLPQVLHCHRRALNVPTRESVPKRRIPVHLVVGESPNPLEPQGKIRRMFFVLTGFHFIPDRDALLVKLLSE